MSVVPAEPQASEPVPPEPLPPAAAGGEDLLGVRIGTALIDLALLFGLLVVLSVTIGEASVGDGFSFYLNSYADEALYLGLVLVYYFALEATIGQTVGKLLTGLRVVRPDGDRPSVSAVAIRTVVRLVDWLPLLYLVGFLTMLATGARRVLGRVRTDLEFLPPDKLLDGLPDRLHRVQQGVSDVSEAIARRYFSSSAVAAWTHEEADR